MSKAKTKNPRTKSKQDKLEEKVRRRLRNLLSPERRKPTPKQMEKFRARMAAREKDEEAYRAQMAEIKARISRLERLHEERKKQGKGEGLTT